jgi:hypothetical protein
MENALTVEYLQVDALDGGYARLLASSLEPVLSLLLLPHAGATPVVVATTVPHVFGAKPFLWRQDADPFVRQVCEALEDDSPSEACLCGGTLHAHIIAHVRRTLPPGALRDPTETPLLRPEDADTPNLLAVAFGLPAWRGPVLLQLVRRDGLGCTPFDPALSWEWLIDILAETQRKRRKARRAAMRKAKGEGARALDATACGECGARDVPSECAACRLVSYCNSTCQRAHWKAHRGVCRAFSSLPAK